jgi:hypothetical protein
MKTTSRIRLALLALLALTAAVVVVPNLAKARRTTSMNSCQYHQMWIETAKIQWARGKKKSPTDTPTPQELLPYLIRITPMWDGHPNPAIPPTQFPTCFLTNAPYLIGNVTSRIQCPMTPLLDLHRWNETEYRYHYNLR